MSHENMIVPSEIGASSIVLPGALPTPLKALPQPGVAFDIRVGTRADIPAIDALQKKHSKALGFFPRAQLEGYIDAGHVLVAEAGEGEAPAEPGTSVDARGSAGASPSREAGSPSREKGSPSREEGSHSRIVGYVLSRDRYLKRDELGAIFQLCVAPGAERKFVGATLLREVFNRSSYGTRLYCCWCAQDLAANKFWEAMGFVPLAFRGGSEKNGRVHIYWQTRIRAGDVSTPYWFPSKTEGGAIREDRIILPIPPGLKWTDELPVLWPQATKRPEVAPALPKPAKLKNARPPSALPSGQWSRLGQTPAPAPSVPAKVATKASGPNPKADRIKPKADPAIIAKARELRDRWLEQVNANGLQSITGKYDVARIAA